MTLLLSDEDVQAVADVGLCIDAVESVIGELRGNRVVMPPRVNLALGDTFLRLMPVQLGESGLLGYKAFHGSMERGVRYLVMLCRASDGEILAIVDGCYLTALRTGATSGVATRHLAPNRRVTVGVIGSGLEAWTNLAAISRVREVEEVRVFSRKSRNREAFARRASEGLDVPVVAVGAPTSAVEKSDVVLVATNTGPNGPPAFDYRWIEDGQYIVSIGATSPFLRELDPGSFDRADTLVLDVGFESMADECGDILALAATQRSRMAKLAVPLADVIVDGLPARTSREVTLFKSVGSAAQDIAAAKAIYDRAIERGVGRDIGQVAAPKRF